MPGLYQPPLATLLNLYSTPIRLLTRELYIHPTGTSIIRRQAKELAELTNHPDSRLVAANLTDLPSWRDFAATVDPDTLHDINSICIVWPWLIDFNIEIHFKGPGNAILNIEISEMNDIEYVGESQQTRLKWCGMFREKIEPWMADRPAERTVAWIDEFAGYLASLEPELVPEGREVETETAEVAWDDATVPWEM